MLVAVAMDVKLIFLNPKTVGAPRAVFETIVDGAWKDLT